MRTRNTYKGITFADGYSRTYEQFVKEFEGTHVFKLIEPKERTNELKKAYKIATSKPIVKEELNTSKEAKEMDVVKAKIIVKEK